MRLADTRVLGYLTLLGLAFAASPQVRADDSWPQWSGPTRDGAVDASGIYHVIPKEGLTQLWRRDVGLGYSGPAIVDGRVFVMDYLLESGKVINNAGKRDELLGKERIQCLSASDGTPIWKYEYDRPYAISYGGGPRCTPTVHNGFVYALGAEGNLTCLDAATGEKKWSRDFKGEFGAKTPIWGHSASPLVHADSLICMVGGEGSLVVSFDLKTGKTNWKDLTASDAGYCPPTVIQHGGKEQLLIWDPEKVSSLAPEDGQLYWQHELKPGYGMSILPPVKEGNLLFASGESNTSAMFRLANDRPDASVLWRGKPKVGLFLATGNAVFEDGHLYGADIRSGAVVCAQASDGKRLWQSALPTTGSTRGRGGAHGTAALMSLGDGEFLILSETGDLISATMTPSGYEETGRCHVIDPLLETVGRTVLWTYPAIAEGCFFVRNDREIVAYQLSE